MKLLILFAFLSCFEYSRAQSTDSTDVYIPTAFYDYEQEFLVWMHEPPTDFCAQVFDRWGNLLLESSDPTFGFDTLLGEKTLREPEAYWLILEFAFPGGELISLRKQIIYAGSRC